MKMQPDGLRRGNSTKKGTLTLEEFIKVSEDNKSCRSSN
jgi:hypothetical protein